MWNDKFDLFNFYDGIHSSPERIKLSKVDRRNIFSELVSNLKKYKGEKQSLAVAQKTWIECITSSISKYFLYNIEANKESFDENAKVPPNLLASWFYRKNRDERLNKISSNRRLLQGKDFLNVNEKNFYFSKTIILGKEYYVLKKLGKMKNNRKFIVNLLWWIGNDVLKLDETYILTKIYVYLSDSDSTVEENITVDNLKEKLGRYFPKEIKRFQVKTCSFDDVFNDIIGKKLSLLKEAVQFEADCYRYFLDGDYVCYELSNKQIDSLEYSQPARGKLYAVDIDKRYKDPKLFKNKRVKVTGTLWFDEWTARFKLNVKYIEMINEKTSLAQEIEDWKKEYRDILKKRKISLFEKQSIKPNKKIIVISQNESQGYADFKKKISLSKDEFNELFELKSVPRFKAALIKDAIRKDLSKDNYQCICIVRGGGDQQQLHEFSKPVLLCAIHDAIEKGIPVIVAIGHASDKPLCYAVDGVYGADTPTDAGIAVKNYLSPNSKKKK